MALDGVEGRERGVGGGDDGGTDGTFKGRHFTSEVILWALRWYLAFPISYRNLLAMLADRGVAVDHTTLFRWLQPGTSPQHQRPGHAGADRLRCGPLRSRRVKFW
jgi:hypothetical protein